jgi:hypothetical protein
MPEPKEIAIAALGKMFEKMGPSYHFPGDAIWEYADENVDAARRPTVFRPLCLDGYLEPTGKVTKAVTPDRRQSPATEYQFGPKFGASHAASAAAPATTKPAPITDLITNFQAACDGNLKIAPSLVVRIVASLLSKRFVILTGLAGSGKTKVAQAFARWITPPTTIPDPFYPGAKLEAATKTYAITNSDTLGVEAVSDEGTKVLLPRAIIQQWADYIEKHNVPETIGAQDLRSKIKAEHGEYSAYLQNFETHYKPAAFALAKARHTAQQSKCYEVVPVGADWTGNENIVGYPDGLTPSNYIRKPALDLIQRAKLTPEVPHFLILDEMNLSHVERYFADLLSMIESEEPITLYCDKNGPDGKPENTRGLDPILALPENLFIIGTVNVDETTYMFSPKVLDRANVIEFRVSEDEMAGFLKNPNKPDLQKLEGKGAAFAPAFVAEARNKFITVPPAVKDRFAAEMSLFFALQRDHGGEYGFRVAHETARFLHFYSTLTSGKLWDAAASSGKGAWVAEDTAKRDWFDAAFDAVVVQKFLPKLHGSKAKLGPLLKKLNTASIAPHAPTTSDAKALVEKLVEPARDIPKDARHPVTAEKIFRMWRQLNENGFTSFPEN